MGSIDEIQQVCRLCLDKDEVNIPIFDESSDARQTFLKISACLPVKVSRDDNLPKNICDGCSCKLDMLYVFRNTSVDSEKQLIQWLNQAGLSVPPSTAVRDGAAKPEILVKQEAFDSSEMSEAQNYLIQQQKLTYSEEFAFGEVTEDSPGDLLPENEEPSPKRARRSTAKRQPVLDDTDDDEMDSMHITKAEADEDDSDDGDQADYGDTASADDQPGPSGVNRSGADAPIPGEYICNLCDMVMETQFGLESHGRRQHKIKNYTCQHCNGKFVYACDLNKHIKKVHMKKYHYLCAQCDQTNETPCEIKGHISKKIPKYKFQCKHCPLSYAQKKQYTEHVKFTHLHKRLVCLECSKVFKTTRHFKAHQERHEPDYVAEEMVCKICEKGYTTRKAYKNHMNKHQGIVQTFPCSECDKTYASKYSLDIHMNRHKGLRPFACHICGKAFFSQPKANYHLKVHYEDHDKPHQCKVCGKGYLERSSLTNHMDRYHKKKERE